MRKSKRKSFLLILLAVFGIIIFLYLLIYANMLIKANKEQIISSSSGKYIAEIDNSYAGQWWKIKSNVKIKTSDNKLITEMNNVYGATFYWSKNNDDFWVLSSDTGVTVYLIKDYMIVEYYATMNNDQIVLVNRSNTLEYELSEIPTSVIEYLAELPDQSENGTMIDPDKR